MQIKQKKNKKILESKSAKLALRKISHEKSKQRIQELQSHFNDLKQKAESNEKAIEVRERYLGRLEDVISKKRAEVETQKKALLAKEAEKKDAAAAKVPVTFGGKRDDPAGPDVMEYIQQKAEIYELREGIKTMQRKIEIAEASLR